MRIINYKIIFNLIGVLILFNSLFMMVAAFVSILYGDGLTLPMIIASLSAATLGGSIYFSTKNNDKKVGKREGYAIVGIGWIMLIISGMFPYITSSFFLPQEVLLENKFSITNLFFETASGYTTTGSTIFKNIEIIPESLIFWRSLTHWIGGMGIIVLAIAILPFLGIGGMQLFVAESSGIENNKLHPRIKDTAKQLWILYVSLTVLATVLLKGFGMDLFDAVNHAMSTMSSGGFSTKNASTSAWVDNPGVQYTLIVFMILSGTNFILVYHLVRGRFKKLIENEEYRWYLGLIITVSLLIGIMVNLNVSPSSNSIPLTSADTLDHYSLEHSIRFSLFQVVSIVTTTGFTSANHAQWTPFISMIFFALLFVGASAGSTSGGIKIVRHVVLLKNSWFELKRLIHPNAIIPVRYNNRVVNQTIVYNVMAFFILYMFIWISGSVLMALLNNVGAAHNFDEIISVMSVTASSLGNIGPGLGYYSPVDTLASLTDSAKWFCAFLMILGRLELFTILILFTPYLWRSN